MTFKLAHLSDPHVGPLPQPALRDLMGKRLTGYWNWTRHRKSIHHMGVLDAIIADALAQQPDHVALTGDLVNLGLAAEFGAAARQLAALADPAFVSLVPGNHDSYVRDSLALMERTFGAHMRGDDGGAGFPYLRVRGGVALIGLSTAIPTLPFVAEGKIGPAQMARFEAMLAGARAAHRAVVIMIHHPPHVGGARAFRAMRDAAAFERVIARHGADLVIHGHNHKRSLALRAGPSGAMVPLVGVASCSAVPGDAAHRAAYHLFSFTQDAGRLSITMDVRGVAAAGAPVTLLDTIRIC